MKTARYTWLPPAEVDALPSAARSAYLAQRDAFDEEVRAHRATIARTGRLEVQPGVYLPVPVPMAGKGTRR